MLELIEGRSGYNAVQALLPLAVLGDIMKLLRAFRENAQVKL